MYRQITIVYNFKLCVNTQSAARASQIVHIVLSLYLCVRVSDRFSYMNLLKTVKTKSFNKTSSFLDFGEQIVKIDF